MRPLSFLFAAVVLLSAAPAQDPFVDLGVGNAPVFGNGPGPSPFKTSYACGWVQYIVLASELQAAGIPAGARFDSTAIIVDAVSGQTWSNVAVYIAHTDYANFHEYSTGGSGSYFPPDFTTQPLRDPQPWTDTLGWNVFTSTQNFYWNGTQNLVLEFFNYGGTTQYPNGAPFNVASVGPTIRATDYGNPSTSATRWGTHEHNFEGESPNQCFSGGEGTNKRFDMRLTFTDRPLNDYCHSPYFLPEGNWSTTLAGGTTTPGLPGAPPFEQEVWYHYVNQTNVTRTVDVSTCLYGATFDPVIAVFTGSCGALQSVVIDDDGCGTPDGDAKATFTAPPGQNFFIAVGRKIGTPLTGDGFFGLSLSAAAPATTTVIGPGCGYGSSPAAVLAGTNPVLGSVGTISVTGAPAGAFVALLLGVPAPPTPFLDGGCPLHLDPLQIMIFRFGMTDAAGAWSFSEVLPSAPSLAGATAGLQAALFSPFHSPATATTNALLLTFGV